MPKYESKLWATLVSHRPWLPKVAMTPLPAAALDQLFFDAHSFGKYQPRDVDDVLLRRLADLVKLGPTSFNSCPARFAFIKSAAGKQRLRPHLSSGNVDKTMAAPVCVIVAADFAFSAQLPKLGLAPGRADPFAGNTAAIERTAQQNATLQGGYLIMAARALGLDCGPMGGFDAAGVNAEFLAGTQWRAQFLCNLGYADRSVERARQPRLAFEEFCTVV